MKVARFISAVLVLLLLVVSASPLNAQSGTGVLRGAVTDPSGAIVVQATLTAKSASGQTFTATSNRQGVYEFKGLPAGKYTLTAKSKGFSIFELTDVEVPATEVQTLDVQLGIAVEKEQVTVEDQSTNVEMAPSNNASSIVIKGKELESLSDDPDELQQDLLALAGPSAGPNGGQIYIDGFANGQLPPKSAIREIRVNQNPFSAQFDRLGYGRVEVFTKPGADKLHGQFTFNENHSALNSKSPFAKSQPDYRSDMFSGNLSGALSKKVSFSINAERRNINDVSLINAQVIDPVTLAQVPFNAAVLNPRWRTNITPRLDYQLAPGNTLTVRYQFTQNDEDNNGISQYSLPTQAFNTRETEQSLQVSDTQVLNPRMVNETRFQVVRERTEQAAISNAPTIVVLQSFTAGGNSAGTQADHVERYEAQNYTSIAMGKHFVKFGGRLRANRLLNQTTSGFNGTYTFVSIDDYKLNKPSQFTLTTGDPLAEVRYVDAGIYAEDDWRIRPNLTLSYGARFETQNGIGDHFDVAPRIGVAWGIGTGKTPPKTVLRTGFGIFYDRVGQDLLMRAQRLNGVNQQQYILDAQGAQLHYPNIPTIAELNAATSSATYRIDSKIHAPYTMQTAVTLERQITKTATATVTYLNSRGVHMLLARNINAPFPGTYIPNVDPGVRPLGGTANIFEYESRGTFKQKQLIANAKVRMGSKFSLFSFYSLSYARGNTSGSSTSPSNPYDINADWGRSSFDARHRFTVGGNFNLPYKVSLSPFIIAISGQPFNITLGQDLNGDSNYNDRPVFATDMTRPSVVVTKWGAFDTAPIAGQRLVPINYGTGPSQVIVNLRVSKTIGFGKERKAADGQIGGNRDGDHDRGAGGRGPGGGFGGIRVGGPGMFGGGASSSSRYNLTISASARNLFNHVNLALPIGNLSTNRFGQSIALAGGPFGASSANRRIDLQMQFSF